MKDGHTLVFYDGRCGLCHRAVRLALRYDPQGDHFRFAPLQGSTFTKLVPADVAETLADSIVVLAADGRLLQQSDAAIAMLREMGGGWSGLGRVLALVPRFLRDLVYRGIANIRHLLFRRPPTLCPVVPSALTERFLP